MSNNCSYNLIIHCEKRIKMFVVKWTFMKKTGMFWLCEIFMKNCCDVGSWLKGLQKRCWNICVQVKWQGNDNRTGSEQANHSHSRSKTARVLGPSAEEFLKEPRGTPEVIILDVDWQSSIATYCSRAVRKSCTHSKISRCKRNLIYITT